MVITGIKYKDEVIFSRARHDYRCSSDKKVYIDGGQRSEAYGFGGNIEDIESVVVEIPQTYADLMNDYRWREDKFGIIPLENGKLPNGYKFLNEIPEEEAELPIIWGSFGKSGKDRMKYSLIEDLEKSHLRAILKNCQIPEEIELKIKEVLKNK